MSKVTVYRFALYNIDNDEMQTSQRWGTKAAIAKIGAVMHEGSATEIDASDVNPEGLTERGFNPNKRTGFQDVVK